MMKKLEKGFTCGKLPQINLKTSYQKVDKPKIKKKAYVKCFECSTLVQSILEDKEAYPRECALHAKKIAQQSWLSKRRSIEAILLKPDCPVLAENYRTSGQCNKVFKVALDKHMSKNKSNKRQSRNKTSKIKNKTCYTCCDKMSS
jgi:hypothetical protein